MVEVVYNTSRNPGVIQKGFDTAVLSVLVLVAKFGPGNSGAIIVVNIVVIQVQQQI